MMKYRRNLFILAFVFLALFSINASAAITELGKIKRTMGHYAPNCRIVVHVENISGIERIFRIKDIVGDDDVQAIILMALATDKDVRIQYEEGVTTGCGTEPMIKWVDVWAP